jgi:putative transposase
MSAPNRRGLLQRDHGSLSIRQQCQLLSDRAYIGRRSRHDNAVELMRRIDQLFTAWPFLGLRWMMAMFSGEGCRINRKRVQRLMRKMDIAALGPKPRTTKPAPGNKIFPYLLRVAIIDWANRALAWRLSNTIDTSFCVSALEEALARFGGLRSSIPTRAAVHQPPSAARWSPPASGSR